MLTMRKIDKIRSLYYEDGMRVCDIARRIKCSSGTISKYVKIQDFNPVALHKKRRDNLWKMLPYEDDISAWLRLERGAHFKQHLTGMRVFELLQDKYSDFACSYYLTQKYFKNKRREFYSLNKQHVPLRHNPGEAQVDFGEVHYLLNGEKQRGYMLTIAFPYSNAVYCQIFKSKVGECLLQGIKNILYHIGGVPHEIRFDNDSGIVKICNHADGTKEQIPTELFLRFKNHFHFKAHFCNSHSPNEKANVEVGIHALRLRMLTPIPEITDLEEFNKQLLAACDANLNRRRRGQFNVMVNNLFEVDKANLLSLPEPEFEVASRKKHVCDNMGRIITNGAFHYYLSPAYIKKQVIVKSTYDKVAFLDEFGRQLCECERLYDPNESVSINWGAYLRLLSVKIGALEHCAITDHFPETLREFLLDSDKEVKRNYLRIMHEVYEKSDFATSVAFADKMVEDCVTDYEEMRCRAEKWSQVSYS